MPVDYYNLDSKYGTKEQLKHCIEEMHNHDLLVSGPCRAGSAAMLVRVSLVPTLQLSVVLLKLGSCHSKELAGSALTCCSSRRRC